MNDESIFERTGTFPLRAKGGAGVPNGSIASLCTLQGSHTGRVFGMGQNADIYIYIYIYIIWIAEKKKDKKV